MPVPLRRRIGALLFGSIAGRTVPAELQALAREFDLGGVTLFARNVESPEQVLDLAVAIEALGIEAPAWVSVDQEGGRVARLKAPFTVWPPAATLGRAPDTALAARFAQALAAELRAVGVTLDFAPVLDILTNQANPAIGDRALSHDAARTGELGGRRAASTFPVMATRRSTRTSSCPWSNTAPTAWRASSSCRFAPPSPPTSPA